MYFRPSFRFKQWWSNKDYKTFTFLACRMAKGWETSFLEPFNWSPPSFLASFHSHPSHLILSDHQNCFLKVFSVYSFSLLSVCVNPSLSWWNRRPHDHCDDGCNEVWELICSLLERCSIFVLQLLLNISILECQNMKWQKNIDDFGIQLILFSAPSCTECHQKNK